MSEAIVTIATKGNFYSQFAPLFEYSAKRLGFQAKVFYLEDEFPELQLKDANAARFLLPMDKLPWDYVYFTDVDFVFLNKQLLEYHKNIIGKTRMPYSGHRGPRGGQALNERPFKKWDGKYSRIAAGAFMATREWLKATTTIRKRWLDKVRGGWIRYRESDEIMLQRICVEAQMKTPEEVGCFVGGATYDINMRDLHLGDFKFKRWRDIAKMRGKFLTDHNLKKYEALTEDPHFCALRDMACVNPDIGGLFKHLQTHIYRRHQCLK